MGAQCRQVVAGRESPCADASPLLALESVAFVPVKLGSTSRYHSAKRQAVVCTPTVCAKGEVPKPSSEIYLHVASYSHL